MCDDRNHGVVIVRITEHPFLLEAEYQRHIIIRSEGLSCFAGDGIGIGIKDVALSVMCQRSHHRGDPLLDKPTEHLSVCTFHITHETKVDTILDRTLMRANDVHISTRKPEGIDTIGLQAGNKILVHQTAIDHRHHAEHISISDAAAVYHLRLDAEGLGNLRGPPPATMYQHLLAIDGTEVLE